MITHIERIKKLKVVAKNLGDGWFFNEILTNNSRRYFLNNRKGLYLIVSTIYGSNIEQWELCIKDATYKDYYPSVGSIGCNLEKSDSAIISDLKNRLLTNESLAYKTLIELAKNKGNKAVLIENRRHVINSLKKVLNLEESRNHGNDFFNIQNENDEKIGGLDHLYDHIDRFNLNLRGVSSENIIKIMGLLAQNKKVI